MGGGGGSSKTQSMGETTTHSVADQHGTFTFPDWFQDQAKKDLAEADALRHQPYEPFEGSVVPDFDPMTENTLKWMEENAGIYQPMYNKFGNDIIALQQRGDVERGDLQKYMNPYIDKVERRAIANAERSGRLAQRGIEQDATDKHAFGGSRQAIQQAVQGAETTRGIGDLSAKLRADAYDKGVSAQQADWSRQFQNVNSAKGLAESGVNLAKAAQAGLAQDYFQLLSGGKMREDKDRERREEVYKKFAEKRGWDKEQLTWLAGLLGITPTGHTEDIHRVEDGTATTMGMSNTKTKTSPNFGSMIGSAGSLLGALA